jgi:Outer membrane protein beta-barrel domain
VIAFLFPRANSLKIRWCVITGIIFCCSSALGQVNDTTDHFPPPPGNISPVSGVLRSQRHLLFIDITQNTWLKLPEGITTKFISGGVNFGLYYDFFIAKKHFSIAPGISFSNSTVKNNGALNYYYDNNLHVDSTSLIPYPDSVDVKTKISSSFFDIPIEFRFRIKPDERGKNFWFAPGFRAGILLSDFWKYKGDDAFGNPRKYKMYDIYGIQNFHYGISLRAGYYKFGAYAFYSLSALFEKGKGPVMVPFSVGITVTPL